MAKYAQIVNGKVHGVFEYTTLPEFAPNIVMVDVTDANPMPQAGWVYDGSTFSEPVVDAVDYGRKITNLAMSNRFTAAEEVAIDLASFGETTQAATIRRLMKKMDQARYIDLSLQQVADGLNYLESVGLLGTGRANEILTAPVTAEEVP